MLFVRSKGWQAQFTHTGNCHLRPLPGAIYAPCTICWGQRRIFVQAPNGEGLVPVTCPSCGGSGLQLCSER